MIMPWPLDHAPADLVERVSGVLRHERALHLLPGVLAALGDSVMPEPLPHEEGEPGRAVDVATILALTSLLRTSGRLDLLANLMVTVLPWLPLSTGFDHRPLEPPPEPPPIKTVTPHMVRVLDLASRGYTNEEIGRKLYLSTHTVKTHLTRLNSRLQARGRAHAVRLGFERGLLTPDES
jgi:DNA-binding CsgD family transcriptional regulator